MNASSTQVTSANGQQNGSGISFGDHTADLGSSGSGASTAPTVIRGGSVSGESHAPTLETSGNRSTGASPAKSPTLHRRATTPKTPERRAIHQARAVFATCLDQLACALDRDADFFNRNNAIEHFRTSLAALWDMRDGREEAFGDIVNMLQALFIQRGVEDFTYEQLEALHSAVEKIHSQAEFDDEFADSVSLDLLDGGLDVFRELE